MPRPHPRALPTFQVAALRLRVRPRLVRVLFIRKEKFRSVGASGFFLDKPRETTGQLHPNSSHAPNQDLAPHRGPQGGGWRRAGLLCQRPLPPSKAVGPLTSTSPAHTPHAVRPLWGQWGSGGEAKRRGGGTLTLPWRQGVLQFLLVTGVDVVKDTVSNELQLPGRAQSQRLGGRPLPQPALHSSASVLRLRPGLPSHRSLTKHHAGTCYSPGPPRRIQSRSAFWLVCVCTCAKI